MPSQFAYLVLFSWPLVVFILFRRLPVREALCWSIVSGYMLLPNIVGFDLPLVPPYDKELVVNVWAAVGCVVMGMLAAAKQHHAKKLGTIGRLAVPKDPGLSEIFLVRRGQLLFWGLLFLMFGATLITAYTNGAPIIQGTRILPGLRMYDALSLNMALLIGLVPFILGRRYLATPEAHLILLKILAIGCLCYSLLVLWELRMSPQLNKQIYGFFGHRWSQHVRAGGYRPLVFMNHGLWLAILITMGSLSAMAVWRANFKSADALKWLLVSLYLLGVVTISNNLGAFLILVVTLPLLFFLPISLHLLAAAALSAIILTYPLLRGSGYVPTGAIYNFAASIDPKRADSLQFRFDNEDELLAHANEKPIAGWGSWGRNRVYAEGGRDTSVTDGFWVIIVGVYGWLGYIAHFGLLGMPIIMLAIYRKTLQVSAATSGLALVTVACMIDLIPNATLSPVLWLFAGALMGRYQTAEAIVKETNIRAAAQRLSDASDGPDDGSEETDVTTPIQAKQGAPQRPIHQRRPREG